MIWLVWLIVALIALAGEAATTALVLASFALAALAVAAISVVAPSLLIQVIAFACLSLAFLVFVRPAAMRLLPVQDSKDGAPSIGPVGRQGTALEAINRRQGQIRIGTGEFWTARPEEADATIPAGADVEVVRMEGLTARVREVTQSGTKDLPQSPSSAVTGESAPFGLSERELEVLHLVSLGLTNQQIAERLYLSPRTVHHHVSHILNKMGAQSRVEAIRLAIDQGLVGPRESA